MYERSPPRLGPQPENPMPRWSHDKFAIQRRGHLQRDAGVEMMAHHQHVQMLVNRVDGVRSRGIGKRGQTANGPSRTNDVRGRRVDYEVFERSNSMLNKAGFVEIVPMNGDLDVILIGNTQAGINGPRGGSPVFMQLQPDRESLQLEGS